MHKAVDLTSYVKWHEINRTILIPIFLIEDIIGVKAHSVKNILTYTEVIVHCEYRIKLSRRRLLADVRFAFKRP